MSIDLRAAPRLSRALLLARGERSDKKRRALLLDPLVLEEIPRVGWALPYSVVNASTLYELERADQESTPGNRSSDARNYLEWLRDGLYHALRRFVGPAPGAMLRIVQGGPPAAEDDAALVAALDESIRRAARALAGDEP